MAKDADLFRAAMADVTPLKGRRRVRAAAATVARGTGARIGSGSSARTVREGSTAEREPADLSFDRDVDRALSRGRRSPEAILDLHGMTLAAAERAVSRFLEEAVALKLRVVLIVTGKGLRQEGGRLFGGRIRAEFPNWLQRADNRGRVRGMKAAH